MAVLASAGGKRNPAHSQGHKRIEILAALLNTCLHPCLFEPATNDAAGSALMHKLHAHGGPVSAFVADMLHVGVSSVRVAAMTATQLCGRLLAVPQLTPLYTAQVCTQACSFNASRVQVPRNVGRVSSRIP